MEYKGKNNLIGKKFGRLLVEDYLGDSYWQCKCDCGNNTKVRTPSLNSGKTKSCGCLRGENTKGNTRNYKPKVNLIDVRFGKLLPKEYIKGGKWRCQCDCGKEAIVDTRALNSGKTRSCGCLVRETKNVVDMIGYEGENLKVLQRAGTDLQGVALWECQCKICGNIFITRGSSIRAGYVKSCGCVHSLNEQRITKLLVENNIQFCTQYTFSDLKGIHGGPLRFDFAIFKEGKLSHLIEFNGIQHYKKVEGKWGENFEIGQQNDLLKINYCQEKNIPLIIIKYDEKYDLNTLLNK